MKGIRKFTSWFLVFTSSDFTFLMFTGYAIIAVPTGIVSSEMKKLDNQRLKKQQTCGRCFSPNPQEANYCMKCGNLLNMDNEKGQSNN